MDYGDGAWLASERDRYFERLALLYSQPLKAFISRQTGNPQDAEDIVQEAFIRAYYALDRYPAERVRTLRARAWLYKIAWNCYCNYARRAQPTGSVSLDAGDDEAWLESEDAAQEQPELVFESAERRRELEALVATLPPRYREVVRLYYFEELSHQEIAEMLNQPIGTIRVQAHRGIGLLRKGLGLETKGGARSDAG
ncbi:MAG TPA: sigma-70 family RNA polymerase sigma factor [Ktedonobacterales bacterium]|jgi:RNA polymerase sigma-70 factor (ECF subfamily)